MRLCLPLLPTPAACPHRARPSLRAAQSKGGVNSWQNLVACCASCNSKKGDKSLERLGWRLRKQPKVRRCWVAAMLGGGGVGGGAAIPTAATAAAAAALPWGSGPGWQWPSTTLHPSLLLLLPPSCPCLPAPQEPSPHELDFLLAMLVGSTNADLLPPEWQVGARARARACFQCCAPACAGPGSCRRQAGGCARARAASWSQHCLLLCS